jgi:hypothetical protein
MSDLTQTLVTSVSWLSLIAAFAAVLIVYFGTRSVRTLVAKRHELVAEGEEKSTSDSNPVYLQMLELRKRGVKDPDVDLFLGVFANSVDQVKAAINAGANVNARASEVLARHSRTGTPGLTNG